MTHWNPVRYLGAGDNILFPGALKNIYELIAQNMVKAQKIHDSLCPLLQ